MEVGIWTPNLVASDLIKLNFHLSKLHTLDWYEYNSTQGLRLQYSYTVLAWMVYPMSRWHSFSP